MNTLPCDRVLDLLPELAAGRLSADEEKHVRAHLAGCEGCRAEAELLALLSRHPVEVPAGLEQRIAATLAARPRARGARWPVPSLRQLAIAASVGAALLTGVVVWRTAENGTRPDGLAIETDLILPVETGLQSPLPEWPAGQGIVAGGAVLDGLTEEQLQSLLEELES